MDGWEGRRGGGYCGQGRYDTNCLVTSLKFSPIQVLQILSSWIIDYNRSGVKPENFWYNSCFCTLYSGIYCTLYFFLYNKSASLQYITVHILRRVTITHTMYSTTFKLYTCIICILCNNITTCGKILHKIVQGSYTRRKRKLRTTLQISL